MNLSTNLSGYLAGNSLRFAHSQRPGPSHEPPPSLPKDQPGPRRLHGAALPVAVHGAKAALDHGDGAEHSSHVPLGQRLEGVLRPGALERWVKQHLGGLGLGDRLRLVDVDFSRLFLIDFLE